MRWRLQRGVRCGVTLVVEQAKRNAKKSPGAAAGLPGSAFGTFFVLQSRRVAWPSVGFEVIPAENPAPGRAFRAKQDGENFRRDAALHPRGFSHRLRDEKSLVYFLYTSRRSEAKPR
jgi:hypothetical protein